MTGEVPGQRRHHQAPGVPGLGPAVDEQQRRSVAADHGVQADAAGVDEPAGEGVGEAGGQAGRSGDGSGTFGAGMAVDVLMAGSCREAVGCVVLSATSS